MVVQVYNPQITIIAVKLDLQNTASVQSKWQAVEGELNHFAAIKKKQKKKTNIEIHLYVSFSIWILNLYII